jgi:hypothetical protein
MGKKLGRIQRRAVETFLSLLKSIPYDKVPKEVLEELAKYGLKKEENETMAQFSDKILQYLRDTEKTI